MGDGVDTVIFDLGGVLIDVDHGRAMHWLAQKGCVVDDIAKFAAQSGMQEHELGKLSGEEFYERIGRLLASPVATAEIHDWWTGFFGPNDDMLAFARALATGYRVYILSNTGALHWQQAVQQFSLAEIARGSLTSFDAGVAKPDARIYAMAAQRFGLQPRRTVFVDDLSPNVRGAQAAGWHGVHHRDFETTASQLERLGVRV